MLVFAVNVYTYAQTRIFSEEQIKEDINQLKAALEEVHPALYHYTSKAQLDSLFTVALNSVSKPCSYEEAFSILNPLVTAVKCGHTEIELAGWYTEELSKKELFPFEIICINDKLYVYQNCSTDSTVLPGFEIEAINGISAQTILNKLFSSFSVDGYIKTTQKYICKNLFRNWYAVYFGVSDEYLLKLKNQKGITVTASVHGLTLDSINCYKNIRYPKKEQAPFSFKIDKKNTAVLQFNTFMQDKVLNDHYNIYRFIDSAFTTIKEKKVNRLILDLRKNAGGNSQYGMYLYSYLAERPFMYVDSILTKMDHAPSFSPNAWVGAYRDFYRLPSGMYKFSPNNHITKSAVPHKNNFAGKLCVLTSGLTLSAGSGLSVVIKENNRGIFIGEECGSDRYESNGLILNCTLKNTQTTIWIPFQKYYLGISTGKESGRGIISDFPFKPEISDLVNGIDKEMEYAQKLILKK